MPMNYSDFSYTVSKKTKKQHSDEWGDYGDYKEDKKKTKKKDFSKNREQKRGEV